MPSSIQEILNELPANLDDTYERILRDIPKQLQRHAYRLFQCMVAASRPVRVDELAEIITIEFGKTGTHPIWRAGFETGVAERPSQLERRDMFSTFKLQVPSWPGDPRSASPHIPFVHPFHIRI